MDTLPPELVRLIFDNLDTDGLPLDRVACRMVCRQWRTLLPPPKVRDLVTYLSRAAHRGYRSVIEWAREQGCPWHKSACAGAASAGRLDLLQWMRDRGCPWDPSTCASAADSGHMHVLRWAREHGCPWDASTCAAAVSRRDWGML